MASTKSTTLSVRLAPDLKRRLARLAKASGHSSNFLMAEALANYILDQERMRDEIRHAEVEAEAGHYVSQAAMRAWLLSWGTDHELPPPACACGRTHGEKPCR